MNKLKQNDFDFSQMQIEEDSNTDFDFSQMQIEEESPKEVVRDIPDLKAQAVDDTPMSPNISRFQAKDRLQMIEEAEMQENKVMPPDVAQRRLDLLKEKGVEDAEYIEKNSNFMNTVFGGGTIGDAIGDIAFNSDPKTNPIAGIVQGVAKLIDPKSKTREDALEMLEGNHKKLLEKHPDKADAINQSYNELYDKLSQFENEVGTKELLADTGRVALDIASSVYALPIKGGLIPRTLKAGAESALIAGGSELLRGISQGADLRKSVEMGKEGALIGGVVGASLMPAIGAVTAVPQITRSITKAPKLAFDLLKKTGDVADSSIEWAVSKVLQASDESAIAQSRRAIKPTRGLTNKDLSDVEKKIEKTNQYLFNKGYSPQNISEYKDNIKTELTNFWDSNIGSKIEESDANIDMSLIADELRRKADSQAIKRAGGNASEQMKNFADELEGVVRDSDGNIISRENLLHIKDAEEIKQIMNDRANFDETGSSKLMNDAYKTVSRLIGEQEDKILSIIPKEFSEDKKLWGAMKEVYGHALHRSNILANRANVPLAEDISRASGVAKIISGAFGGKVSDLMGGAWQVALGRASRYLNDSDFMIKSAFERMRNSTATSSPKKKGFVNPQAIAEDLGITKKTDIPNDLLEEAKKYESVDEFVNAQTEKGYRSVHQVDTKTASPITSLDENIIDDFVEEYRRQYGYPSLKTKEVAKLKKIMANPDSYVTIYRASPKNELNSGDWVTIDRDYANDIKRQNGGTVYKYTVKASDLFYPKTLEGYKELPSLNKWGAFQYQDSKTKSQLEEIWKQANNSKRMEKGFSNPKKSGFIDPKAMAEDLGFVKKADDVPTPKTSISPELLEEAKKYKSVEEFVKNKADDYIKSTREYKDWAKGSENIIEAYHGTPYSFDKFDVGKKQSGAYDVQGISFSTKPELAEPFSRQYPDWYFDKKKAIDNKYPDIENILAKEKRISQAGDIEKVKKSLEFQKKQLAWIEKDLPNTKSHEEFLWKVKDLERKLKILQETDISKGEKAILDKYKKELEALEDSLQGNVYKVYIKGKKIIDEIGDDIGFGSQREGLVGRLDGDILRIKDADTGQYIGEEIIVNDPSQVFIVNSPKTKSQLEDIWKQANSSKKQ